MPSLVPLEDIFKITHGHGLDLNKLTASKWGEGTAFINRSGETNGVAAFVRKIPAEEPFPAGRITVALGGSTLSSFIQPWPFYTGQNVDVLEPRSAMSLDVKLYYCLCIEANRFRYSTFGREANRTLKKLLLPTPEKVPPWVPGATKMAIDRMCHDLLATARV